MDDKKIDTSRLADDEYALSKDIADGNPVVSQKGAYGDESPILKKLQDEEILEESLPKPEKRV